MIKYNINKNNYLIREILHLVRTNNKVYKRRISECSLLDEIDQVFGGFLTRRNIGSLNMLMHVKCILILLRMCCVGCILCLVQK